VIEIERADDNPFERKQSGWADGGWEGEDGRAANTWCCREDVDGEAERVCQSASSGSEWEEEVGLGRGGEWDCRG